MGAGVSPSSPPQQQHTDIKSSIRAVHDVNSLWNDIIENDNGVLADAGTPNTPPQSNHRDSSTSMIAIKSQPPQVEPKHNSVTESSNIAMLVGQNNLATMEAPQDTNHQTAETSTENSEKRNCRPRHIFRLRRFNCPFSQDQIFEGSHGEVNFQLFNAESNGPLAVTVHGLNGTRATFQDLSRVLGDFGFRVLSFDLYGHGLSASPSFGVCHGVTYTPEFFVAQLDELLDHLNLQNESIILVGFSMGCLIAAVWASIHPERTRKIVLIAPAGLIEKRPQAVKLLKCCKCCVPCWPWCICRCCFSKRRFIQRFPKEDQVSGSASMLWNRLMWQFFEKKGGVITPFMGCVSRMPLWSGEPIFRKIGEYEIPVLTLWGMKDTVVDIGGVSKMLDCISNCHAIVFPNSSHLLLVDAPRASIASIVTFLEFPDTIKIKDYKYLLPFDEHGNYRSPKRRHPSTMSQAEYFKFLEWKPRQWVKLPTEHQIHRCSSGNDVHPDRHDKKVQDCDVSTSTHENARRKRETDELNVSDSTVTEQPLRSESMTLKNSVLGEQAAPAHGTAIVVVMSSDKGNDKQSVL